MRVITMLFAALPLVLAVNTATQAQESRLTLEETIITASKRETALQDTPIAVTAFSADMMQDLDINNPFDYEALVPSLTFQQTPNRLSIRGVGRFSNSLGVQPGVAIYNDGVFTAEATALSTQPINILRTEILRGPQGTLYGRNTTGGAVNIITRRPTAEFEADLRVTLGNYDYQQYGFVVSGPLTDSFRYKVHYIDTERDGLQDNKAGEDLRTTDQWYGEVQIEWDITEQLHLWAEYGRLEQNHIAGAGEGLAGIRSDPYDCVNSWAGLARSVQFLECERGEENPSLGDRYTVGRNAPGKVTLNDNNSVSARLSYDFEGAELSYLFGLIEYDYDSLTDYDGTPNPDYQVNLDVGQYQKQLSHELQLTSNWDRNWNYLVGLYYFDDENEQPFNINAPDFPTFQNVQPTPPANGVEWDNPLGVIYFQNGQLDAESWAIFGEVGYDINEQWALTLGARYSEDEYDGGETQLQYYDPFREFGGELIPGIPPDFPLAPYAVDVSQAAFAGDPNRYVDGIDETYSDDFSNWTGKATLSYRPWDGHLFWGTLANGYKMGGTRLGSLEKFYSAEAGVPSDGKFEQEEVLSYELGWKAELMDKRLQTELVAFFYSYDDMQRQRSFKTPPPANITLTEVINVDNEMYGLEATATWLISDNIRGLFTYSYNHSEITSDSFFENFTYGERDADNNIIPENVKGAQMTLTPEHKAAASLHYFYPSSIGEFTFGGTYSYMGKRYFDLGNHNSEDDYTRLDMQASWTSSEKRYRIQANVSNATDEEAFNTAGCSAAADGVYGTESFIIRCGGNPLDQRLYTVEFSLLL